MPVRVVQKFVRLHLSTRNFRGVYYYNVKMHVVVLRATGLCSLSLERAGKNGSSKINEGSAVKRVAGDAPAEIRGDAKVRLEGVS